MLKIKDEIDLKDLEIFGLFKRHNYYTKRNRFDVEVISVMEDDKIIEDIADDTAVNTLYDLIQAGLVEKVKE